MHALAVKWRVAGSWGCAVQRKIPGQRRNWSYLLLPRQVEMSVMTPDDNRPGARCAVLTTFFAWRRARGGLMYAGSKHAPQTPISGRICLSCVPTVFCLLPQRPLVGGATRRDGFTSYLRLKDGRFEPSNPSVDVFQRIGIHR